MPVVIRTADPSEHSDVLAFWRLATEVPSSTDDPDGLDTLTRFDDGALLVAIEDDCIVGTLIAAWDGWRGAFYRLGVHPDHRGRGVARALVLAGEARLAEHGCRRISLYAVVAHEPAVAFWRSMGYRQDQEDVRFAANLPISR
ncbi:MAG TPA: GNAT family N-acetyltransferase [Acidimicrobiales bacterium]